MQGVIKGLRSNSGLTYALKYFADVAKAGIGVSRRAVQKEHGGDSQFVHAWSTFHRYTGILKEFIGFAKSQGINRIDRLDYGHTEKFLNQKVKAGRAQSTVEVNMAALKKFCVIVGKPDIARQISCNYSTIKYQARTGHHIHAFSDPDRLIAKLPGASAATAETQRLCGARIGEVKKPQIDHERMRITFKGKGGKVRTLDFVDREEKFERIVQLQAQLKGYIFEQGWRNIREQYYEDLRNACSTLNEEYYGAHGFRGVYSQERETELKARGLDEGEIELIITRELGHERRSMARHYLRC